MPDSTMLQSEDLQERYERYKAKIKNFTIMNDIFMRNVLKKKECTEYILQVIMEDEGITVIDQALQKDYKNLQGRSATLDCVAKDASNRQFNVEIQGDNEEASPKRARYHCGLLDMNILNPRESFDAILGFHLPIYHIDKEIIETKEAFDDGQHIIYVNASRRDSTELGHLMHDLHCKDASEMYSDILSTRVRELKESEKGMKEMCKELEEIYNEGEQSGVQKGIQKGELKKARETVFALLEMGMPVEQITKAVKIPLTTVQSWIAETKF